MNFFENIKVPKSGEIFETLHEDKKVMIEKIVSSGESEQKIYKQDYDEWVMIMEGSAVLELQGEVSRLKKGDFLTIKKGVEHQVLEAEKGTIWFCVHIGKDDDRID